MYNCVETLRLGILHYHLLRGGVQTVIVNTIRALLREGTFSALEVDLISSDAQQTIGRELIQQLIDEAGSLDTATELTIRPIEIAELDYNPHPATNKQKFLKESRQITEKLVPALDLDRCDQENPYLLHVHNMNLGKNPHATCAIKLLADRMEQQNLPAWILYQMHDFAEEHRPACWQALKNCTGHPDAAFAVEIMYPTSGRIVWACLNSADRNKLLSIGIPPEKVHVLPNTIDTELFTAPPLASITEEQLQELHVQPAKFNTQLKHRIEDFAKQNGFTFSPAYKILLAPIKAIRRKNLAESILLMMSMNHRKDPWQLLVTLPANTEEDLEYCREMETFVKENELPVVIGFGAEIISGHARQIAGGEIEKFSLIDLMAISKAIVTTSIQEGFGYVFHEGWLTGKAVLGRNIGHLTCDFVTAGMRLEHLYDHLLFPMEWLGPLVKSVKTAWYQKLDALWENTDFDRLSASKLQNMLKNQKIFTNKHGPMLDFADLDLAAQLHIIKKVIESPPLISHLVWTDKEGKTLPGWYPSEISGIIEHNREVVSMKYNLAANARKFLSLVDVGKRTLLTSEEHRLARYTSNESIFAVTLEAKHVRLLI